MNSFENSKLANFSISHDLLKTVRLLGEYRGKEDLYQNQAPQILKTLRQSAIIQSAESSNRLEGVIIPDSKRLKNLVESRTQPENRSEQEIAGYRDVLNTLNGSLEHISFTPNIVPQFHRNLFQFTADQGGLWKQTDNTITETAGDDSKITRFRPVPAWQTSKVMEKLHKNYVESEIDALLAIPAYILDFLCIHPFKDGNGRMARLLSLLLLYKSGYTVGRYISLERIVEDTKESYYDTLYISLQGWHEGRHNLTPWFEYFLGVMLLSAYREFEKRVGLIETAKGAKAAMIVSAIEKLPPRFTISDVAAQCPTVGIDHIRKTLRAERDAGKLRSEGRGPKAMWVKVPNEIP
jgi:Fic family protein